MKKPEDVLNSWRTTYNNKTSTLEESLGIHDSATNQQHNLLVFANEEPKVKIVSGKSNN